MISRLLNFNDQIPGIQTLTIIKNSIILNFIHIIFNLRDTVVLTCSALVIQLLILEKQI